MSNRGLEIVGRTHHILVSAYGSRWPKVNVAMFTLFLDDSGTRPTHKVAVASALIVPSTQIINLEKEWNALKTKEGFSCFHASVCNARDKHSEFTDWSDGKVDRIFARVMQIAKKYGARAISCSTHKKFYDEAVKPEEIRRYFGTYHYTWCVGLVIADAERWRKAHRHAEPFAFIFDYMEPNAPARIEIEKVLAMCERANREQGACGDYTKYNFLDKKDIPGLQCADEIAWTCNRIALHQFNRISMPERAKRCWIGYGGPKGPDGFLRAFTVMKNQLQKVVADEIADGRTFVRIQRWEREDDEKKNKS